MTSDCPHSDRLTSEYQLAGAYRAGGRVIEAVKLLEHVVVIEEKGLKADHPDRLASQYELAVAYRADRQIKEAVKLLEYENLRITHQRQRQVWGPLLVQSEQVVAIKKKVLREDDCHRVV